MTKGKIPYRNPDGYAEYHGKRMRPDLSEALRAIRAHCLECSGGSRTEVERCKAKHCNLYPYRSLKAMGITPAGKDNIKGQINLFDVLEGRTNEH